MGKVVLDLPQHTLILQTAIVPLAFIALVHAVPILWRSLPERVQNAKRLLLPPSDGFESNHNSEESPAKVEEKVIRSWKVWAIATLSGAEAVSWFISAVWMAVKREDTLFDSLARAFIAVGWTYPTVAILISPPISAPYTLFVFYLFHSVFTALHMISFTLRYRQWNFLSVDCILLFGHILSIFTLLYLVCSYPMHEPKDKMASKKSDGFFPSNAAESSSRPEFIPSPEENVTLFEWIIFSWVSPMISRGQTKKLGYSDVWELPSTMASEGLRQSALLLKSNRIIPRIFFNNSLDLILSLCLGLFGSFLSYLSPYFLQQILTALSPPSLEETDSSAANSRRQSAYVYATLALLAQFLRAEVDLQQLWHERRAIIRCRSQLMGEVYTKALKRRDLSGVIQASAQVAGSKEGKDETKGSKTTKRKTEGKQGVPDSEGDGSTGKIVQLMSSDVTKVALQLMGLSSLVAAPFELVIAIGFLYQLLGWTCIAGLSIMVFIVPVNNFLVKRRIRIHRSVLASRDQRMDVLNEFVQAIRFIKYNAAEEQWLGKVFKKRNIELDWLLKTRLNSLMFNVIWNFTPDLVMVLSFALFTKVLHKDLTVPIAFTSLALFALVRSPMTMLPTSITSLLQTYVSIQRLEKFMEEPEVAPWVSNLRDDQLIDFPQSNRIAIVDGTFRYQDTTTSLLNGKAPLKTEPAEVERSAETHTKGNSSTSSIRNSEGANSSETQETQDVGSLLVPAIDTDELVEPDRIFELSDINVEFPLGQLSLLCGATGSGKSSLFLALLGEMDCVQGEVYLPKGRLNSSLDNETRLYEGIAYAGQLPWLEHMSIRDNILFGSPFEQDRYDAVLEACALKPDLLLFAAGDHTEIGEKGISLSGGTKARVALGRAAYSRAKTVLLDDPLSAVDSHTARHIFTKCIKGSLMHDRTVILITHHIALCLRQSDYIVKMSSGRIELKGKIDELNSSDLTTDLVEEQPDEEETLEQTATSVKETDENHREPPTSGLVSTQVSDGKLVEEELQAEGRVKGKVYYTYLSAAGWYTWLFILFFMIASRLFRVGDRYWFKLWGESYRSASTSMAQIFLTTHQHTLGLDLNTQMNLNDGSLLHFPSASDNVNPYILGYLIICIINLLLTIALILAGYSASFRAARMLFTQTLTRVAYAPFRYYDITPTGRILNRFSMDFFLIDLSLTDQLTNEDSIKLIQFVTALAFIVNIGVIVIVSPTFIPPAILIIFAYVKLSLSYVRCSRDLRRLESNARSPIFSKFGETLAGIVTCRAFGAERRFLGNLFNGVDKMLACNYAQVMVNRYLLWRFDCLGAIAVAITTYLALAAGTSPGLAALAITSAQGLVQAVYWLCRYISALEVDLNAVERVIELLEIPQEPEQVIESHRPPAYWPSSAGGISFNDLYMSYSIALPPVIKGVTFDVEARQKIGIVGRTGSGKSTLALSLLRFNDPTSGSIIIDGIDITKIGLNDLRSRLTLIPQEAVLFSGTIRTNLDPFNEYEEEELKDVLYRVGMTHAQSQSGRSSKRPSRLPSREASNENLSSLAHHPSLAGVAETSSDSGSGSRTVADTTQDAKIAEDENAQGRLSVTLNTAVSQGGNNFSAGQRQLLAMARALLRRSKIIVMDEATASVDFETDLKIQRAISEEFADSLILTIAHRLATVINYDKILVLDAGELVEFDTPKNLLAKEGGMFRNMCEQAADRDTLRKAVGL